MKAEDIARVCHEANRALTAIVRDVPVQPPWDDAPGEMRESSIRGVNAVLNNPGITPKELHEKWCADKLADGWVFGEEKDATKKTHPALRPYEDLPLGTRKKDVLFRTIVSGLTNSAVALDSTISSEEYQRLVLFKEYVHSRLDAAGIPRDPEPEKNAKHGCRIEGRLNSIFGVPGK